MNIALKWESRYYKEVHSSKGNFSEINDIEELIEGTFPIHLKLIQKYQQAEPSIKSKYIDGTYHKGYFH